MSGKSIFRSGRQPGLKAVLVAGLVLLMGIPLFFVAMIADERQDRATDVIESIGYDWGGQEQTFAGPFLVIPIDRRIEQRRGAEIVYVTQRRFGVILPESLSITAATDSQVLHRGIYDVPVFTADMEAEGRFPAVSIETIVGANDTVRWDEAFVTLSLTDTRGIRSTIHMTMAGKEYTFAPGPQLVVFEAAGAHARVPGRFGVGGFAQSGSAPGDLGPDFSQATPFHFQFSLNGSSLLRVVPLGGETNVEMTSDWTSPSFQGAFLPVARQSSEAGFSARWVVPNLARSFPDVFVVFEGDNSSQSQALTRAAFGVDFIVPLDFYQKTFRALRYAMIFIGFTFLTFFLVELVMKRRLHAVQYLMIGAVQSIFYLLLLSAAEHIGFALAFGAAATATVVLIAIYGGFISQSIAVGGILFGVLGVIYLLLYNLLLVQDYALLYGSMAAFVALAVTMLVTRNVNWYGDPLLGESSAEAGVSAPTTKRAP